MRHLKDIRFRRKHAGDKVLPRCGATGKVAFRTEGAAYQRAGEILDSTEARTEHLRAYQCRFCGQWHITSQLKAEILR
jgi:hypothetical protein